MNSHETPNTENTPSEPEAIPHRTLEQQLASVQKTIRDYERRERRRQRDIDELEMQPPETLTAEDLTRLEALRGILAIRQISKNIYERAKLRVVEIEEELRKKSESS